MGKLAICVPTYNHPEVVRQINGYCAGYLKENGVDIYYYDSSTGDETKQILADQKSRGYDNIYHVPVSSELNFGQKVDLIFSGYALEDDYEYIWPVKDRVIHNESAVKLVLDRCNGEISPAVIIVLMSGDIFNGYHIDIDSPAELYKLFGKQTTSLETVVYNRKTMLKDYGFGEAGKVPKYRNDFWHYDLLYRKLAETDHPVISIISKSGAVTAQSDAAKGSGWHGSVWEVWIDEWIRENFDLPDIYTPHKLQVIKDTTSIDEILGSAETLRKYRKDGLLNEEIFNKYADMWQFVTNVPLSEIEKIATE